MFCGIVRSSQICIFHYLKASLKCLIAQIMEFVTSTSVPFFPLHLTTFLLTGARSYKTFPRVIYTFVY